MRRHGMVLVAVLWINILLIMMVAMVTMTSRLELRSSAYAGQEVQCLWAARAGTEMALAYLKEDSTSSDGLNELWCDNEDDYQGMTLGDCIVDIRVIDEAGKLSVNKATKEQLLALPEMTEEIAEAILDWRDGDDTVREGGAEEGYYKNLTYAYPIRNGSFRTLRELLLVKGVTEELFYGEDTNRNGQLDWNEQDGDENPPMDDRDSELDLGWIDLLTCTSYTPNTDSYGNTRVNISEADQSTLQQNLGITASQAKWIVDQRGNGGFDSLGDLINEDSPRQPSDSADTDDEEAEPMDVQTYRSIVDQLTLADDKQTEGLININTAPRQVLEVLFHESSNPRTVAEAVMAQRSVLTYGFSSVGSLLEINSIDIATFKRVVDFVTVRSNVFTIQSEARARYTGLSAARIVTETIVDRGESPAQFIYHYQGARYQ